MGVSDLVREVASDINCSCPLAYDLLKLAGWDADLVREASRHSHGVESVKADIIDRRFRKLED